MPKRILQDVVTSSRKGRKIETRRGNFSKNNKGDSTLDVRMPSRARTNINNDINYGEGGGFSRFAIWGVAAGAVILLFFVLLSVLSGTVVKITPLQKKVVVSGLFSAQKDAQEGELPFKLIVLDDTASGNVVATDEKEVERKASGEIVIYNAYSSKSQKLIKRTRFETPDGKVYRINKSVIVPGTTVENGKVVPGSVEVTVYADIPGEEYNIGLTDFTIPGFKGDPRFDKFYARSKTPMDNGFSGKVKVASEEDVSKVEKELQNSLKEKLLTQARSQVPGDFILYDDAVFFSFDGVGDSVYGTKDNIDVTEKGTVYGVLFNKKDLSRYIASSLIENYNGGDVYSLGLEDLKFKVKNKDKFDVSKDTKLSFSMDGNALIVWEIDDTAIARDLAGTNKADFLKTISKYTNIKKATAVVKPFWRSTFPENSEDITIRKIDPILSADN